MILGEWLWTKTKYFDNLSAITAIQVIYESCLCSLKALGSLPGFPVSNTALVSLQQCLWFSWLFLDPMGIWSSLSGHTFLPPHPFFKLTALAFLRLWLDIWLPPLEPPNCFNQLPLSIFFLSTTPAPALQERYFSLRGSSPHTPSALFPRDSLTCGLSRRTYVYSLQWVFFFSFIFISWRLITLQYCSGFCHTLTWISHGFTCVPHPDPRSHLPLHPIPLGLPSAPGPSTWLMHQPGLVICETSGF